VNVRPVGHDRFFLIINSHSLIVIEAAPWRFVLDSVPFVRRAFPVATSNGRLAHRPAAALGIAYKRDTSDVRESPALDIIGLLKRLRAEVSYGGPYGRFENWRGGP